MFHLLFTLLASQILLFGPGHAGCRLVHWLRKGQRPQLPCYSGVVLRDRCWDGVLIQVDSQFPIGESIQAYTVPDSLGNTNVIAANNSLGTLAVRGQRIYFAYTPDDPKHEAVLRPCTANEAPFPVPHVVLHNVSTAACSPLLP